MRSRIGKVIICLAVCFVCFMFATTTTYALASVSDGITQTGCNYPSSLMEGKSFALKGVVTSAVSKLVNLQAGVYDSSDKMVTGRSWNPNAKSVDLRWYVDSYVKFGTLSAGSYTYKITATNASEQKVILSQAFTVTPKPPASDNLTVSGCNYPNEIAEGKGFSLRGIVSSQISKMSWLEVGVYDEDGNMITGRSWNPKAKKVDLRFLVNSYVKFSKLDTGYYTYRITATNDAGKTVLINEAFEVIPREPISDDLTIGSHNHPSEIVKGKGFALKGMIKSQSSKITKVVAGVFDDNDNMLTGRSFNPKAKTVDIRWLINPYVKFGKLDVGTYTYRVSATNASGEETLLEEEFIVTPAAAATDKISASGLNAPKLLLKGRGFYLRGVVKSQSSKLTNITAGVYDSDGNMLTGRSWNPKDKSIDFRWYVNPYVKFGTLDIGSYTYKVTATNGNGTSTLLEEIFEVVK